MQKSGVFRRKACPKNGYFREAFRGRRVIFRLTGRRVTLKSVVPTDTQNIDGDFEKIREGIVGNTEKDHK